MLYRLARFERFVRFVRFERFERFSVAIRTAVAGWYRVLVRSPGPVGRPSCAALRYYLHNQSCIPGWFSPLERVAWCARDAEGEICRRSHPSLF